MPYQAEVNDSRLTRNTSKKIRVLIVDDQRLHCQIIQISLGSEADIEVVGLANDGETALKLGKELQRRTFGSMSSKVTAGLGKNLLRTSR